jgi:hypothetical protein
MKRFVKASSYNEVIFEDEFFDFVRTSGIGRNNIPWTGLAVKSKGLAKKHVIEVRLNSKGWHDFETEDEVIYTYSDAYVSQGMRMESDTLEETEEVIEVLQDAVDFARRINDWLFHNN